MNALALSLMLAQPVGGPYPPTVAGGRIMFYGPAGQLALAVTPCVYPMPGGLVERYADGELPDWSVSAHFDGTGVAVNVLAHNKLVRFTRTVGGGWDVMEVQ